MSEGLPISPDVGLKIDLIALAPVLKGLPIHHWAYSEQVEPSHSRIAEYSAVISTPEGTVRVEVGRVEEGLLQTTGDSNIYALTAEKVGSKSGFELVYTDVLDRDSKDAVRDLFDAINSRYIAASKFGRRVKSGQDAVSALNSLAAQGEAGLPAAEPRLSFLPSELEREHRKNMLGDAGFTPEQVETILDIMSAPVEFGSDAPPKPSL